MSHPITTPEAKRVREGIKAFLHESAYSIRNSDIVFVCGGNEPGHMRSKFLEYARENLSGFRTYLPEYSFKNIFSLVEGGGVFIDLNKFEESVARLSCCVLVFPEAAGSLVELGLFSSNSTIVERLLVVIDDVHDDGSDSFILLGPVNRINSSSDFRPVFIDPYNDAVFEKIKTRLNERYKVASRHEKLNIVGKSWSQLTQFQKLISIHWIVDICRLANVDAVAFLAKSIFGRTLSKKEVIEILSILIANEELEFFGEEKWIRPSETFDPYIMTRSGDENTLLELKMSVNSIYLETPDFSKMVEEAYA